MTCFPRASALSLCILIGAANSAGASILTECRDARLSTLSADQLLDELQQAGGSGCKVQSADWGQTVSCERVATSSAWGLPVRELSAEVQNSGRRTVLVVTSASLTNSQELVAKSNPVAGLALTVEPRDDGVTTIRCVAEAHTPGGDNAVIVGNAPPLPVGASQWDVCAQPVSGRPICSLSDGAGRFRIESLAAGEYGLIATPIGATDPLLRAMLIRAEVGETAEGGPRVLAGRISLREGAEQEATELTLLRMPPEQ